MSHHIKPCSVSTYLSSICQQLKPYFPNVHAAHLSPLVERTMKGCMRLKSTATKRKCALTIPDLEAVLNALSHSTNHDNLLFQAMLLTGFFALMHLGELTFPDDANLHNWRKVTKQSSLTIDDDQYGFLLPSHKADR